MGADAVRRSAERLGGRFTRHKTRAEVADVVAGGGFPLTLAVPGGYMNGSGGPVQALAQFYKVPLDRLVVVHDDLDLPLAALRLKRGGGSGGHNGLRDIEQRLGSREFLRVRIGIGRPPGREDPAEFVLRRFSPKERDAINVTVEQAADAILLLAHEGLEAAQNRYHAR